MDFSLLGLSGRDKRVYEALLAAPVTSIRSLAEHTRINRGSVYESIKALRAQGLVSYVEVGKQIRYSAEDPELLHELIRERRGALKELHTSVDTYISHLSLERHSSDGFHFASFYEGDEGLATILRNVLSTCKKQGVDEYLALASPKVSEYLYTNFPHFTRERVKHGIRVRVVRQGRPAGDTAELAESRSLEGHSDPHCYTLIYCNKVAFITLDTYNQTRGVIIENDGVAQTQAALFEAAWKQARK